MTKLEEKLKELGYEYIYINDCFGKKCSRFVSIFIGLDKYRLKIEDYDVENTNYRYKKQSQIDNLQQAFDIMQKDLEELRKYE